MGIIARHLFPIIDGIIILLMTMFTFANFTSSKKVLALVMLWALILNLGTLFAKKFYKPEMYKFRDAYTMFEGLAIAAVISAVISILMGNGTITYILITLFVIGTFLAILATRIVYAIFRCIFKNPKNVLIVGAGQDGKLIAEEIQQRPELGMNVVGFLDDNMNNIEDEDSSIPILGLTCDSEAVIKDNNVKVVIIAVKSRMNSNILTDLVKGIPLGVKVWRMYRFYEKITHKFLVSKMSVNWLFYDCVRKKALLYASLKRFCDIIASIFIMILTLPLSLIAAVIIKLSDLGPIFFTQTRMGKFGKPFKLIKFRTMYQDKVEDNYDEDLTEVTADDKRIMPACRILRKFHIDDIPMMINVLRGDMSIVGPRPVREEVYEENRENIPFWECRNWVHPGWCGWQQVNVNEPTAEERVGYDLYYIKHRHIWWEFAIFLRFVGRILIGKGRGK